MENGESRSPWWSAASIRISHPQLDTGETTQMLGTAPSIAQHPGQSKVPHGACKSAGYWCLDHRVDYPERPDHVLLWVEQFASERKQQFRRLLDAGCEIDVYIGVHSNILALGFVLPASPTLWGLGISVGIEFFS